MSALENLDAAVPEQCRDCEPLAARLAPLKRRILAQQAWAAERLARARALPGASQDYRDWLTAETNKDTVFDCNDDLHAQLGMPKVVAPLMSDELELRLAESDARCIEYSNQHDIVDPAIPVLNDLGTKCAGAVACHLAADR